MKIVCVGLNYEDHIKEFDRNIDRSSFPTIFMKPDTALLRNNDPFYIPTFTDSIDYETELVVKINRVVKAIDEKFAARCYDEVAVGIDFTARSLQSELKKKGMPWELSKAFDKSTPVPNEFVKLSDFGSDINNLNFHLDINSKTVQRGCSKDMIFSVNNIISYVSQFVTLKIGDLIFTGTPSGVGRVNIGDRLEAYLEDRKLLDFEIK